ncbi:aldo/keto reductase [Thermodesulfobacteriota bacterium]
MEKRYIGKDRLEVPAIALGCMGMSVMYGKTDDEESIATIHAALDLGINFFDTSDAYGPRVNEELVGKALKGKRHEAIVETKFGFVISEEGRITINGRAEYVKQACNASLKRLGMDYVDLYYPHRLDPETPMEETVGAMAELVKEGKVRYLGLSEASAGTIRRANDIHPITALQSEYSIWSRDVEEDILPTCRELMVGLVAFRTLGQGFFAGQFKGPESFFKFDLRKNMPRFQRENLQNNLEVMKDVEKLAEDRGCKPSQLALAWLLARGDNVVPLPGTKRRKYLLENAEAVNIKLTDEELKLLNGIAERVRGDRYDPEEMKRVNQ